jgi:hypothetical protein
MATTSNAGSGMSFSNLQRGTRGMSASDWIRMKRLNGAKTYQTVNLNTNKDIAPPQFAQNEIHNYSAISVFPTVGTSKIRRTASDWINYRASQTADYITYSQAATTGTSIKRTQTKLCDCSSSTLNTKQGICTKCNQTTHVRIM